MVGICSAEYRPSRGQPRCDQHLVEGRWLFRSYIPSRSFAFRQNIHHQCSFSEEFNTLAV